MIKLTIDGKEYYLPDGKLKKHNNIIYLDNIEMDIDVPDSSSIHMVLDCDKEGVELVKPKYLIGENKVDDNVTKNVFIGYKPPVEKNEPKPEDDGNIMLGVAASGTTEVTKIKKTPAKTTKRKPRTKKATGKKSIKEVKPIGNNPIKEVKPRGNSPIKEVKANKNK